jgi:hypothetical protein
MSSTLMSQIKLAPWHAYKHTAAHCSRSLCYVRGNNANCKIATNEIKTLRENKIRKSKDTRHMIHNTSCLVLPKQFQFNLSACS